MAESDELVLKVRKEYFLLSMTDPDNELLKYYILRPYRGGTIFYPNKDKEIQEEFFEKFGRGLPELISDLKINKIKLSPTQAAEMINCFILKNYYNALEKEVIPPEIKN